MMTFQKRMAIVLVSVLFFAPVVLGEGEKPKDNDPRIKEFIGTLKKAYKKKNDDGAISAMDALTILSREAGPKDRKNIAKALADAFKQRRKDNRLVMACSASLSTLGDLGAKPLVVAATKTPKFKRNESSALAARVEIVKAIGHTKSEKVIDDLIYLLKDKDYPIIAASCDSLSHYKKSSGKIRKKIVQKLVTLLSTAEATTLGDPNNTEARLKYDTIGGPSIAALRALTAQDIRKPQDWNQWWNKNKSKEWKALL